MDKEVVDLIEKLKSYYVISSFSIYNLHHPLILDIIKKEFDDPKATIGFFKKDQSTYSLYLHDNIKEFKNDNKFNLLILQHSLGISISMIFDLMMKKNLIDSSPELQFFRHIRNAVSHGNRFFLKKGEPKFPAKFKDYEILPSHNNFRNVLFDYIMPGDILDLFDYIKNK